MLGLERKTLRIVTGQIVFAIRFTAG